jgi:hypothetical protein
LYLRKAAVLETVVVDCLEQTKQSMEFLRHVLFNGRCLALRLVLMASPEQVRQCKEMRKWIRDCMVQVVEDGEDLVGSVRGVLGPLPVDRTKLYSAPSRFHTIALPSVPSHPPTAE